MDDDAGPIAAALREMISRPYEPEGKKCQYTISTVKIPSGVWERLNWVATLTGRPKQEIIADALKDHFRKVVKER